MPAIVTNKFRVHNQEQFVESFSESGANVYYMMLGRPQPFATSTRPDARTENEGTDSAPIAPIDSVDDEFYTFDDAIAAKKITSSDVSIVIPRRNWTTGTTYDYYRHDYGRRITGGTSTQSANSGATNLFDATFFVVSSAYNVYKVLDNNAGAASTVEPTGTSTSTLTTGDGYKWKYMYTLSATQQANFLSTDFMAVATNSTVSSAAVNGALDIVKIKTAGSGYTVSGGATSGTITSVPIRGDGASGACTVTLSSGVITAVAITTAGTGYTYGYIRNADILSQGGGAGSGAELDVIIGPKGGHGSNAIKELGGFFVMLNTNFEGVESGSGSDVSAANDFRKIALIRDPQSGGGAASATTLRATKAIRFAASPTPGTFTVDEEINQATTGAVGKVVEYDSTNRILYYIQTRFNDEGADSNGNKTAFSTAAVVSGQDSSATGTPDTGFSSSVNGASFTGGYSSSELDNDTGDVMYIENRAPITRATDQTENVKLVVEF
tara:strand:+ start:8073 stop:9560 length:1488 start_codon:yes stop_codon:yes gene_type:complete